jgi:azurin
MHVLPAFAILCLLAAVAFGQAGPESSAFKADPAPLDPGAYPLHRHPVNRDRVYDFYAKQARFALAQPTLPVTLPPYPGLDGGKYGHWGNQNEKTWEDGRWNEMDLGSMRAGVFNTWGVARAVCVRLGDKGEMAACFDPDTLRWVGVWTGGFLKFSAHRKGFLSGCALVGQRVEIPVEPPAARGSFTYHGFYRHGARVVFRYTRDGKTWLDSAWCKDGQFVRTRTLAHAEPLASLTKAGPGQWPQILETKGTLGTGSSYVVDTITLPKETPWRSLFHMGDHDFFANGDAAVCTIEGEVWLVRGLDDSLDRIRWKRFAAGLHEPLGLKIADDKVYVLGRDQITLLHDSNSDDEADYYECFSNAFQTSAAGHDFITGLQRDAEGRFIFASSNQGIVRISRDGKSAEVLATGFRNPDGLGLGPRGEIIASVQEGEWTPASMLAEIQSGGHYGYRGPKKGLLGHVPPIIYMPRGLDNSCGGQVFVEGKKWGVPEGTLVHLSFGVGRAYLIIRDAGNPSQAAAVPLPGDFSSGAHRGRFHPKDGQLYVTGTAGWGTYTPDDGCFQRLRYTGGPGWAAAPYRFAARSNGILLSFVEPIDAAQATQPNSWFAQMWNYRYGPAYGSDEFTVRHNQPGHDVVAVTSAHVLNAGHSLFLEIPQLQPSNTLHLHSTAMPLLSRDLFLTMHQLGTPFTKFPGYQAVVKVPLHHHQMPAGSGGEKPMEVKWEQGTPGRVVRMETTTGLQYAQRELRVKAGERISLSIDNPDVMPHNWVLGARGAIDRITDLANKLVADPKAIVRHYVPDTPDVLVHTRIIEPANSTTIHFDAPKEPGDYPYLCTFPGHATIMRGVMKVE